jgi:[NiFe] hydrogenase diaphorase moiety large subunit
MNRSRLLTCLWEFQNKDGYISDKAISEIAQRLKVSNIEIEGVISFYHFFHRQPTGKYIVYLNNSIISEFKGFKEIKAAFEKETGCTFGCYDQHPLFSLFETSCIGLSDQEPAALINFLPFTNLTPERVKGIVKELKNGTCLKTICDNPTSTIQFTPPENKTVFFRKYHLGKSLEKLKEYSPEEILKIISKSHLAGRGGAFFPTAQKWKLCKENQSKSKYLICNADEGEPGTFKDKALLDKLPGLIIEGMITAAYTTGAQNGYIYLRAEYKYLLSKIEDAINKFYQNNLLGNHILGIKDFNFNLHIQLGAGAYVCGAETALIESLEGKRGEPRIRIHFPTDYGYLGGSTVVNNVETFAMAARILELGSDYIDKIGTDQSKGTKILSVSGDVGKPGIYEVEWGTTIRELLHMKMSQATSPYYIQVSGPSGECIGKQDFDRKICKEDLVCGGSIMVFSKFRSVIQILENFTKFFKTESCGTCTPCRAGNQILYDKIQQLKKGICTMEDLEEVKDWSQIMKLTSRCGLGQYASNTFALAIDRFEDYFKLKTIELDDNNNVEFDMEEAVFDYDKLIKDTQF